MACCIGAEHNEWCEDYDIVYVDAEGKEYCIFHAPAEHKYVEKYVEGEGQRPELMAGDDFNELVFAHIQAVVGKEEEYSTVDFARSIFFVNISFSNLYGFGWECTLPIDFNSCHFLGETDFSLSNFSTEAGFANCKFYKRVDFSHSKFKGEADFSDCIFKKGADFEACIFQSEANFRDCNFKKVTNFHLSKFIKSSNFRSSNLEMAYFNHCEFRDETDFSGCIFIGEADFMNCQFRSKADFLDCQFKGRADFMICQFRGKTNFWNSKFLNEANFTQNDFRAETSFQSSFFKEGVDFQFCKFREVANFPHSEFHEKANFESCQFRDSTDFQHCKFFEDVDFNNIRFNDYSKFERTEFSGITEFKQAFFKEWVYFKETIFKQSVCFSGSISKETILFENVDLSSLTLADTNIESFEFISCIWPKPNGREVIYDEIASGKVKNSVKFEEIYRRLKKIARINNDELMTSAWHYKEKEWLRKRLHHENDLTSPRTLFLRFINNVYWLISGYGEEPIQAFGYLLLFILCPLVYTIFFGPFYTSTLCGDVFNTTDHLMLRWLWFLPFSKVSLSAAIISDWNHFFKIFFNVVISLQTALFAFALRNKLRR